MKPAAWLQGALLFACFCTLVAALEVGTQDSRGGWRTMDDSQWPVRGAAVSGARKQLKAAAGIDFQVQYDDVADQTGFGFDDPALGATRRATLEAVLGYLNSVLDELGACQIECLDSPLGGIDGATLASGKPIFFTNVSHFEKPFALQHITTGADPDAFLPDMTVLVDFTWDWSNDLGAVPAGNLDLYSVLLREITRGLGMVTLARSDGKSLFTDAQHPTRLVFSTWDNLLLTGQGTKLWKADGVLGGSLSLLTGAQGGVVFGGARATAAYGSPPPVYAPNPFEPGASLGAWAASVPAAAVMRASIGAGQSHRVYGPLEFGVLQDLGYHIRIKSNNPVRRWDEYR